MVWDCRRHVHAVPPAPGLGNVVGVGLGRWGSRRATWGPAAAAQILRRATFGPFPGVVQRTVDRHRSAEELIESLVAAPPVPFTPEAIVDGVPLPVDIDAPGTPISDDPAVERARLSRLDAHRPWWVRRMRSDEAGLHERMMWFWHGHFTTSSFKVDDTTLCWRQLRTLHDHALGNFGDLAKAMTIDGAMLRYLDGDGSLGRAPNENYGRELMELFTIGIGGFTQDDVEAAAAALAGWRVVPTDLSVEFDAARATRGPVEFLGHRGRLDPDGLIDILLEQESCAPFVVRKLAAFLIGDGVDDATIRTWADSFRNSGYEIAPLVGAILRSEHFVAPSAGRPRTPIEWYCGALRVSGDERRDSNLDLFELGQSPYLPPNVSGWPPAATWTGPTQMQARAMLVSQLTFPPSIGSPGTDPIDAALEQCSIFDVGDRTRQALARQHELLGRLPDATEADLTAATMGALLLSPEFSWA